MSNSIIELISCSDHRDWYEADPHILSLLLANKNPQLLKVVLTFTTTSVNFTEIRAPDNILDGTTTPVAIAIKSGSDGDRDQTAGHARQVTIIGWDENDAITMETISLNGVTLVAGTTLWKRIFHAFVSKWGTGDNDALGEILVRDTGDATTYLTITAADNHSNGGAVYVPTGKKMTMHAGSADQSTRNNGGFVTLLGWDITSSIATAPGLDPDHPIMRYAINSNSGRAVTRTNCVFTGVVKATPKEAYFAGAETFYWETSWLIWDA